MITIVIDGLPISTGENRKREKEFYQWQIKAHYTKKDPISCAVDLSFQFQMPIPRGISKARKTSMINGIISHLGIPYINDLENFIIDSLEGIVFESRRQINRKKSEKIYSESPRTIVKIYGSSFESEGDK